MITQKQEFVKTFLKIFLIFFLANKKRPINEPFLACYFSTLGLSYLFETSVPLHGL